MDLELIKEILFWFFAIVFVYHIIRIYMLESHLKYVKNFYDKDFIKFSINGKVDLVQDDDIENYLENIKLEAVMHNAQRITELFDVDVKKIDKHHAEIQLSLIKVEKQSIVSKKEGKQ